MRNCTHRWCIAVALLLVAAGGTSHVALANSISEPSTIFYGKVVGTGSAQDFLITEGNLSWTIERSDGSELTLNTTLFPLQDGTLSYRLDIPHTAVALGLDSSGGSLSLPLSPVAHAHTRITVDGEVARLLGPAGSTFTTEQLLRASSYRLDLAISRAATDTDGDGIADAWEDLYGLDKQNPADASLDLNGDGLTALDAYLRGLDPGHDARTPALLTQELVVYSDGSTGVLIDTADSDSRPDQLTYTLTGLPAGGALRLRNAHKNPSDPDQSLALGDTFTQADLCGGRVLFTLSTPGGDAGFFSVEVRDEVPEHAAAGGQITLLSQTKSESLPIGSSPQVAQYFENAELSAAGLIVLDGRSHALSAPLSTPSANASSLTDYLSDYGPDLSYVLVGGKDQYLKGGESGDVLRPGEGSAEVTGGPGADRFQFYYFTAGRIALSDFSADDADLMDLSRLPSTPGALMHRYLRVITPAGKPELQVDLDGDGSGYTNLTIVLPATAAGADLYQLVSDGSIDAGSLVLEPRISILASQAEASESGAPPGRFVVQREGSLSGDLEVHLDISGSAQNGTDYLPLPSTVLLPNGVSSVELEVQPNADSLVEPGESVHLALVAGPGYQLGSSDQATVIITDRLMLIGLEVLKRVGDRASGSAASIVITRSEVLDRDVLVRFRIGGTAANGSDYETLSDFVLMGINQTRAIIQIVPKPGAVLTGGAETVRLTVEADDSYGLSGSSQGDVVLVERMDSLADWKTREFPSESGELTAFLQDDSGATGVSHLERYAFGLDPHAPDPAELPHSMLIDGQFVLTFRRPAGVTDVTYRIAGATNLQQWSASGVTVEQIPAPIESTDPQQVFYRLPATVGASETGFVVVEVDWTP